VALTVSLHADGRWCNLRSQLLRSSVEEQLIQITFPIAGSQGPPAEIAGGEEVGVAFRRGHKKCVFVSRVVMRRAETDGDGNTVDTLLLRLPQAMQEHQRRAYQRVTVPADQFIAVKLWEGGVPGSDETCWPLCAGRLANVSAGGILLEVRADQDPRLSVGDTVGVEITTADARAPLLAEAQYRHCCLRGAERVGLGLQFLGLEHDVPGQASIGELAAFVKSLQRPNRPPNHGRR
jgi:c-di-GMP-binding flagellar brake protein YcgR